MQDYVDDMLEEASLEYLLDIDDEAYADSDEALF